jgi:hypothetical protein
MLKPPFYVRQLVLLRWKMYLIESGTIPWLVYLMQSSRPML